MAEPVLRPSAVIPQAAPGLRIARYRNEIDAAIARVVGKGQYILGPECENFEELFARYLGASFVIGVNSGTDAISLALRAVGVEAGQEVIVPAMTAPATAVAIQRIGGVVSFADVDPTTRALSPAALENAISPRTAAVVVVHLHGAPAPLSDIRRVAERHHLAVIEDCAQAHGVMIDGRHAGTLSDAAAFSFYPTKNLGALGDGGAVVVHARDQAERVRRLRNYGRSETGVVEFGGMNSRLDEVQASVLSALLPHLETDNAQRRVSARRYDEALAPLVARGRVQSPPGLAGAVYHQYAIEVPERNRIRHALLLRGVQTAIHYSPALHRHRAFSSAEPPDCPVADRLADSLLSLPIQPEIMRHQPLIIDILQDVLSAADDGSRREASSS
jgi:dTDP-3-amino-3,4,6-trideoxy-alpha-D-glucose transaminase